MQGKRTAITGIACILPWGKNLDDGYANFSKNNHCQSLKRLTSDKFGEKPVGLVPDHYFNGSLTPKERNKTDRVSMLVQSVVEQCIESAGITGDKEELRNTGIISGSGFGCTDSYNRFAQPVYEKRYQEVDPTRFPMGSHNYPISISAIKYGLFGPINSLVLSMSAGLSALCFAHNLISLARAKRIIVVGFDEITPFVYAHLDSCGALGSAENNHGETIPFEGCSAIVIEGFEEAEAREARIFGEIAGYYMAYSSLQGVDPVKIASNIKNLYGKIKGVKNSDCLFLSNGSGLDNEDELEATALNTLQKEGYPLKTRLVLKPLLGNFLGASGMTELVFTLNMLNAGDRHLIHRLCPTRDNMQMDIIINNFARGSNLVGVAITNINTA